MVNDKLMFVANGSCASLDKFILSKVQSCISIYTDENRIIHILILFFSISKVIMLKMNLFEIFYVEFQRCFFRCYKTLYTK